MNRIAVLCLIWVCLFGSSCKKETEPTPLPCNGSSAYCSKKYDQLLYPATHNSYNVQGVFALPNQTRTIAQQLNDGIRGLMIDVYPYDGTDTTQIGKPYCFHTFSFLGSRPLADILGEITTFMNANPREIVSIIFESYVEPSILADAITNAGLQSYCYTKQTGKDWSTLAEMIATNKRLVLFTEKDNNEVGQPDWLHYAWAHLADTDFSVHNVSDFNCATNRGSSTSTLFLLNHFVTNEQLGVGDSTQAKIANANPLLINRLEQCQQALGKRINFVGVDFYEMGDVLEAVKEMNTK